MIFARSMAFAALSLIAQPVVGHAADAPLVTDGRNPLIDYRGFVTLARDVAPVREERLVSLEAFAAMRRDPRILLLDARSERAFAAGHVEGAVNLPFPDFTAEALRDVIGDDPARPILIYCNNNFTDNRAPVVTKSVRVALNVQTFINLAAYGYTNVWELGEATSMSDPRMAWVGTSARTALSATSGQK